MAHGSDLGPIGAAAAEDLRQLVRRAERGDEAVLPELRRLLDREPGLWHFAGNLARQAEEALIGLAAGDNLVLRESVQRKVAELKAELAPNGPLERLLVERIAACWVACNHADTVFGQSRDLKPPREGQIRRRQDSSHRRLLEALKLLATVKRLLGAGAGQGQRPPRRSER